MYPGGAKGEGRCTEVGTTTAVLLLQHTRRHLSEESDQAPGGRRHLLLPELLVQREVLRGVPAFDLTAGMLHPHTGNMVLSGIRL